MKRACTLVAVVTLPLLPHAAAGAPNGLGRLFGNSKTRELANTLPIRWHGGVAAGATGADGSGAAPAKPAASSCSGDEDCPAGEICQAARCAPTAKRPINIAYLFYRSGDRRFTEILGIYWYRRGRDGYRIVFPFYWDFWEPSAAGDRARRAERRTIALPFLLSGWSRDPAVGKSRGVVGLYYWHQWRQQHGKQNHDHATRFLFPLFYHHSGPTRGFGWYFPLNFYWRRGKSSTLLVPPILFRRTSERTSTTVSLTPPLIHWRNGDRSQLLLPPLLYHRRDAASSVWIAGPGVPIAYYRRTEHSRQFVSPLVAYENDDQAKVQQWGLLLPPYYRRRDAEREIDTLFPLFWRWHNRAEQTSIWAAGPLLYFSDPEGSTRALFPLYWHFADNRTGNGTSILFPLFYRHSRPDGRSFNLVGPFYYRKKLRGFSAGLFPLLFTGSDRDNRHAILFPLLWHVKNPTASTTLIGPAYLRRVYNKGWFAGLPPLLFLGNHDGDRHRVLFPLFWQLSSRSGGYETLVAGPFFHTRSRKGRLMGLLPLFATGSWNGASVTTILPPLFYRRRDKNGDGVTLAGLYYNERESCKLTPRAKVCSYRRRSRTALFPFFFQRETIEHAGTIRSSTTVLPLLHYRRRQGQRLLVTPIGGFRRDDKAGVRQGVVGPVVWSHTPKASGFALLPLIFHWRRPADAAVTTVVLPFGVLHRSRKQHASVLFPLFWHFSDATSRSLVFFPLYYRIRSQSGENADVLFPLAWRLWNNKRRFSAYGPYFSYEKADTLSSGAEKNSRSYHRSAGVFPLALYQRNHRRSYLASLPLFFYHHNFAEKKRTWVWGPGYFRRCRDGYGAGLFPLFFHKRRLKSRYTVLTPIFWHFANDKAKTSTTVAGPVFLRRNGDYSGFGLLPLFYRSSDGAGGKTTAVLPLFYYRSEIGRRAIFTPLFGLETGVSRKLWYAATALHVRTPKRTISGLLPLFLYHRDHPQQKSTLLMLPLYYGSWSPERSFHLGFPLFWHYRRVDSRGTVLFPVYWDFNDRHRARTTVVFPLFLRHRNRPKREVSYLTPPGVWLSFRPKSMDAIVFPLFWHFGGVKRSSTVGFPLYWDFKRPGRRTTVFFPLYWRFDRPGHTSTVVLNSYYRRNKRDGTYAFHFIPLFNIQRKRPGDIKWEFIPGGLFGYERIGRNRFLTLFFFIHVKLDPTGAAQALGGQPAQHRMNAASRHLRR